MSHPKTIFKEWIDSVQPYEPGKPIKEVERELGLRRVIKLASNENPLGPSRKALRAMKAALAEVHLYPESSCHYLVQKLSQQLDFPANQIVIGNGSNEIIELLARGFLNEGDEVISSETSFLVYPILAQVCGAKYVTVPMKDYRYDLEGIAKVITNRTKIIFIANPNNPTGTYVTSAEVDLFLSKVPNDVLVCFDEAYVDFVDAPNFPKSLTYLKQGRKNVLVFRTFSKAFGLAGVRIGYGVASPELVGYFHKIRQPFNVNSIAQVGATAALDDKFFLWRTKHLVSSGRKYYYKICRKLGVRVLPSQANFVLIDTGYDGEEVFKYLLSKGLIVRSMKAYGLKNWIRVTIGRRSQNVFFYKWMKSFLEEKRGASK